jgi:hypothetical protein
VGIDDLLGNEQAQTESATLALALDLTIRLEDSSELGTRNGRAAVLYLEECSAVSMKPNANRRRRLAVLQGVADKV